MSDPIQHGRDCATVQHIFDKHRIKSREARDEIALELVRRVKAK